MGWFVSDTFQLLLRHVKTTLRIPIWILVTLVQPVIWLALYGQLFRRIVDLPGFQVASYIDFLTPGVVIMTAFFGSAWSGMGLLSDLNEGVMSRLLATPVSRGAIIAARVLHAALTVVVQSSLILGLGLLLGASFANGLAGSLAVVLVAALLGSGFSAVSNGLALLARREETLISVINFFGLPLTFLSSAFIASVLMPGWIRAIARFNPVNWAVEAAREAVLGSDWAMVLSRASLLALFAVVCGVFATRAFVTYQRSL
ncbi:Daunorubicin/doxorubicin resistance ABC transporter permease protein DrrB [bacterium HR26]|nr:Daunorubicin/doxorubicin resistance ABC transporter permease protein DrrB [bacterium HR26]